jgi:hypothetical protein
MCARCLARGRVERQSFPMSMGEMWLPKDWRRKVIPISSTPVPADEVSLGCYAFVIAGMVWRFFVSDHPRDYEKYFLQKDGRYSNKLRGRRARRPASVGTVAVPAPAAPPRKTARRSWAALLQQVYEVEPLCCPHCGAEMKNISSIEPRQAEVIEWILRRCGLWEEAPTRGAPPVPETGMG